MKHDDFQDIVRVSEFQLSFQMRLCQYHVPWQPASKRQLEVFYSLRNGYMEKCVLALALAGYSHGCTSTNELLSR